MTLVQLNAADDGCVTASSISTVYLLCSMACVLDVVLARLHVLCHQPGSRTAPSARDAM